jgi:hypothetical protein
MQNFDNGLDAVDWYPVANGDNATSIEAKVFNGAPLTAGSSVTALSSSSLLHRVGPTSPELTM